MSTSLIKAPPPPDPKMQPNPSLPRSTEIERREMLIAAAAQGTTDADDDAGVALHILQALRSGVQCNFKEIHWIS